MAEPFKQYAHTVRAQVPEENYGKGMQYTNVPIPEGFCRIMVNYDLKDFGNTLAPRPALTDYEFISYGASAQFYNESVGIEAARECTEDDGVTYGQFIMGQIDRKDIFVVTAPVEQPASAKYTGKGSTSVRFQTLQSAVVHNIPVADLQYIHHRLPGTFAFNNNYYFFDDAGLNRTKFDDNQKKYVFETLTPKALRPSEAVMWGYNMLSGNPYGFGNSTLPGDVPIYLEGILPYDENNALALSPRVNQALIFKCFYRANAGKTYTAKWEWRESGASIWTELKTQTITTVGNMECSFNAPDKSILLRLTVTNTTTASDFQVMTIGFDFGRTLQGSGLNSEQATYDLRDASSMVFWKNRLALSLKNLLFLSEVNDPSYFPYPNNMEPFDEDIVYLVPHLDNLLVFTTTKLYSMVLAPDGLSWTVKCIQRNLNIAMADLHLIQPVKNMVFFKSGNYYYMVVPKASSTIGELTIAPVSKAIEPLFDDFQTVVTNLLRDLYNYSGTTTLVYYYNFLDFEDMHNIYVFQTAAGVFINIDVIYNTVSRTWRLYAFESQHIVRPYQQDATARGTFMTLVPVDTNPCIQLLRFDPMSFVDSYVAPEQVEHTTLFKNHQMLDTGYRAISDNLKKRFREAQLKLNNKSGKILNFYTAFYIDGENRKALYRYTLHHETDPLNPDYGLITMVPELVDPDVLPGVTALNQWALDVSRFPEIALWKIRIPISGKGYSPRMVLLSHNEEPYELLNNIWVFRQLNSR